MNEIERIVREFIPHKDAKFIPDLVVALESLLTYKSKTITVWKDGTWKLWRNRDAELAVDDPNWLLSILLDK